MPQFSRSITFGNKQVYVADPQKYPEAEGLANSYYCPIGSQPGVGYLLMAENDAAQLVEGSNTPSTLQIQQTGQDGFPSRVLQFNSLYPISMTRVGGGGARIQGAYSNPYNHLSLLQFADPRYFLNLFSACDKIQANIKEYMLPTATGGTTTVSGTSSASWQAFINTIWGKLPSGLAGTAPTLPYSPDGTPEGWQLYGGNAWLFLDKVLSKIHCAIKFDPTVTSNPFSIVELGTSQNVSYDNEPNTVYAYLSEMAVSGWARAPEKLRICFPKHFTAQPEWSATRMGQWLTDNPIHYEDVSTGITGALTGTLLELWDDKVAETGADGTVSNSADLSTRATERKNEWIKLRNKTGSEMAKMHHILTGLVSIFPGSQVTSVWWKETNGLLQTEVTRGLNPRPLPPPGFDVIDETRRTGILGQESEVPAPPDLERRTWPNGFLIRGVTDASIAKNASGSVSVYNGGTDTTRNITATNIIGTVASGKKVICAWFDGAWYIVSGEC